MFKRLFTAALLFGAAAHAPPAEAQVACAPRADIVKRLADGYSEQLAGAGLQNQRQMIEVWAAPGGGTFTVLVSRADGLSCIVATGDNWQQRVLEVAGVGASG